MSWNESRESKPGTREWWAENLQDPEVRRLLKELTCSGTCTKPKVDEGCLPWGANCRDRRLSALEEMTVKAQQGFSVDIPTVDGAGGVQSVEIGAYGVAYYLREFSMDGNIAVNTGSLSRVEVEIIHAGVQIVAFRASQYTKNSCCTTIVDVFRERQLCFGWDSKFTLRVKNSNALAQETFVNGVFSFMRGFPP